MHPPSANRKYSDEEKRQLIANLDIEVAHRCRQFEAWLSDRLENFTLHQEGQVSRIPKQVRGMTMREFGEKYDGNIQLALRGFQKDKLAAVGADASFGDIDKSMRKRKWIENHEVGGDTAKDTDCRPIKNAKTAPISPNKPKRPPVGSGSVHGARLIGPSSKPGIGGSRSLSRIPASPSPEKLRPPFNNTTTAYNPRPPSRPASPVKPHLARVPSTSSFNPSLPSKTPHYPSRDGVGQSTAPMRLPRKDENMLSVNGSPIANPYQFGLGWFRGVEMQDSELNSGAHEGLSVGGEARSLKRSKSSIVIRRDPSMALSRMHSRTTSQASIFTAASSSSSQTQSTSHSREGSQSRLPEPSLQPPDVFRFPSTRLPNTLETPRPDIKHSRSFSAMVAITTHDGHLLEFDPLQTSPGAIDALEGITDSAKKQARVEMGRLVQAAVDKWKI